MMATFMTANFVNHDDYMTPKAVWEDILEYIPKDGIIWESFYGDGSSGNHLRELGLDTFHQEIDFFTEEPDHWDLIVSNPPFTMIKQILKKLFVFDKPFILIMPSSKINTQYFREWKDKGIQIIIPKKRIQFIKLVNGAVPENYKSSCNFDCFYYCYKIGLEKDIVFL